MEEGEAGSADVSMLLSAFVALRSPDEARAFVLDICSPREIEDLCLRLEVARLLLGGSSYTDVSRATGASSTTVSRVSKCLNGKRGGYRLVLGRIAADMAAE